VAVLDDAIEQVAAAAHRQALAALSDALRKDAARASETLRCGVTPSDGKLRGPTASAAAVLPG
jgi:hypothetical protein